MRNRFVAAVISGLLLLLLMPAHATAPAALLVHQTFHSGAEGWVGEGSGGSLSVDAPVWSKAPSLSVTSAAGTFLARSPEVPNEVKRFVWHFQATAAGSSAIVMGARGPTDSVIFNVRVGAGNVYVTTTAPSSSTFTESPGTTWHRLDAEPTSDGYDITLDQNETLHVVSAIAIHTFVVAPHSDSPIRIADVAYWGEGSALETAFLVPDSRFEPVGSGVSVSPSGNGGVDNGSAFITGGGDPGALNYVRWSIADIGPKWETSIYFANRNDTFPPDHMAVLAGLDADSHVLWALTVARPGLPDFDGSGQDANLYLRKANGSITDLGAGFGNDDLHAMRAIADAASNSIVLWVDSQPPITLTDVAVSSTTTLAVGDVYGGRGNLLLSGLNPLGPSGTGQMIFDDIVTAAAN